MISATRLILISLALNLLTYAQDAQLPIPCCDIDAAEVPKADKESWCSANLNSCVESCGGQSQIRSSANECNSTSLAYTCRCDNGIQPDLRPYSQSVPAQKCRFWYGNCVTAAVNDAERSACVNARDTTCGSKEVGEVSSSSSALLRSAASSATSTRSQSTFSSSTRSTPSTSPSNIAVSQSSSVPVGTIVGAVVGSVGGVVVVVVLTFLYRRHQKSKIAAKQDTSLTTYEKPELHGTPAEVRRAEMPGGKGDDGYPYIARNVELSGEGSHGPLELAAATPIVEAGTHWPHGTEGAGGRDGDRNGTGQH